MATIPIYFDESGFTGRALLDPVQPHFVVASTSISDEEAGELLAHAFPTFKGGEFKATEIWRRDRTRGQLLAFAELVGASADRFYVHHIDKRFCVLTKLIDHLVEPVFYDMGRDFYRNAYAPRFCNQLHYALKDVGGDGLYDAFILPFYEFARTPTQETQGRFEDALQRLQHSGPDFLADLFGLTLTGLGSVGTTIDPEIIRDSLDIQLTSVFTSVGWWQQHMPQQRFDLRHDSSSNFFRKEEMWQALTAQDVPPQIHQMSAGVLELPLKIDSTAPVDSRTSRAIQLVDLVAGTAARIYPDPADEESARLRADIIDAGFGELPLGGVRPGHDFVDGPPPRRVGPDILDQLVPLLAPRPRRR